MKRIAAILLLMFLLLPTAVLAETSKVVDHAEVLTLDEEVKLESMAQNAAQMYRMDIVIVTVPSLDGKDVDDYANDFFDDNGYGLGDDRSGIIFLLAISSRDWAIRTWGDAARAVRNAEIDSIFDSVSSDLSSDQYYDAFREYLDLVESEYEAYGGEKDSKAPVGTFLRAHWYIPLCVGLAVAGIVLLILRSGMNSTKAQRGASSYMVSSSYDLFEQRDIFLYSRTSRLQKSSNSGSSGRSSGGRSGKF